ncbi:MAG: hypothetical protein M1831_006955 [Alyxoria varia]|nr:MAG: hypothetical protein M1831_006955 [Alyxoria varia]
MASSNIKGEDMTEAEEEELLSEIHKELKAKRAGSANATNRLYDLTGRLHKNVQPPEVRIQRLMWPCVEHLCLVIAVKTGLLDALVGAKDNSKGGISAGDLAAATQYEEDFITRIMRLLVTLGIGTETGPAQYRPNQAATWFAHSGHAGTIHYFNEIILPISLNIHHCLPTQPQHPLQKSFVESQFGSPFWELLQADEKLRLSFEQSMDAIKALPKTTWFDKVPAADMLRNASRAEDSAATADNEEEEEVVQIVDVGGGTGEDLLKFRSAHPDIRGRFILQDLPQTISGIPSSSTLTSTAAATATGAGPIEAHPHDFFNPQPIHGARLYFLHHIAHDWPDERALLILQNVARAMRRGVSRLLLYDLILPETGCGRDEATFDVVMMCLFNGRERTRAQWEGLLREVRPPLEISKVWRGGEGDGEPVLEVRLEGDGDVGRV